MNQPLGERSAHIHFGSMSVWAKGTYLLPGTRGVSLCQRPGQLLIRSRRAEDEQAGSALLALPCMCKNDSKQPNMLCPGAQFPIGT